MHFIFVEGKKLFQNDKKIFANGRSSFKTTCELFMRFIIEEKKVTLNIIFMFYIKDTIFFVDQNIF